MNGKSRSRRCHWRRHLIATAVALSLSSTLAVAGDFSGSLDARYRYEHVEDDAYVNSANAHMVGPRSTWRICRWRPADA